MRRSWARWLVRRKWAMSCIASAVSRVIASGDTRRKRPAGVSIVSTPSVVSRRYSVGSGPSGSVSVYPTFGGEASAMTCTVSAAVGPVGGPGTDGAPGSAGPLPAGWFVGRIGRPTVLRVAPREVLAHVGPRAGPEAGQVGGHLERPVGGGEQGEGQRHPPAGH